MAQTVLAMARKVLDVQRFKATHNFYDVKAAMDGKTQLPRDGFCFVGMISYSRDGIEGADKLVKQLKQADIKVVMVSSELCLIALERISQQLL